MVDTSFLPGLWRLESTYIFTQDFAWPQLAQALTGQALPCTGFIFRISSERKSFSGQKIAPSFPTWENISLGLTVTELCWEEK